MEEPVKTEQGLDGAATSHEPRAPGAPRRWERQGGPGASGGSPAPRHPDFRLHPPAPEEKEVLLCQAPGLGTLVSAPRTPTSHPREGAGEGHSPGRSPGLEPRLSDVRVLG